MRYLRLFRFWWFEKIGRLRQYPFVSPAIYGSSEGVKALRALVELCKGLARLAEDSEFRDILDAHEVFPTTAIFPFAAGEWAQMDLREFLVGRWVEVLFYTTIISRFLEDFGAKFNEFLSQIPFFDNSDLERIVRNAAKSIGIGDWFDSMLERATSRLGIGAERICVDLVSSIALVDLDLFRARNIPPEDDEEFKKHVNNLVNKVVSDLYNLSADAGVISDALRGVRVFKLRPISLDFYIVLSPRQPMEVSSVRVGNLFLSYIRYNIDAGLLKCLADLLGVIREQKPLLHRLDDLVRGIWEAYENLERAIEGWGNIDTVAREYVSAWQELFNFIEQHNITIPISETEQRRRFDLLRKVQEIFKAVPESELVKAVKLVLLFRKQRPRTSARTSVMIILGKVRELGRLASELYSMLPSIEPFLTPEGRRELTLPALLTTGFLDGNRALSRVDSWAYTSGSPEGQVIERFLRTGKGAEEVAELIHTALEDAVYFELRPPDKGSGEKMIVVPLLWGGSPEASYVAVRAYRYDELESLRLSWLNKLLEDVRGLIGKVLGKVPQDWKQQFAAIVGEDVFRRVRQVGGIIQHGLYRFTLLPLSEILKVARLKALHPELIALKVLERYVREPRVGEGVRFGMAALGTDFWKALNDKVAQLIIGLEELLMMAHGGGSFIEAISYHEEPKKMFRNMMQMIQAWVAKSGAPLAKRLLMLFLRKVLSKLGFGGDGWDAAYRGRTT